MPLFSAPLFTALPPLLLASALALPSVSPAPADRAAARLPALHWTLPLALLTPDAVLDLMQRGQLDEAEAAARAAVGAHPESARARVVLARILARQGRLDEARALLAEAKALPQWTEEDIGVPYGSPREIDRVMQHNPQAALGLIADVLLAEGDDPQAYYLQSLAYVQLGEYDASQLALNRAREYGDVADFAHPDTLRRLEELLRERPAVTATVTSAALGAQAQDTPPDNASRSTQASPGPRWLPPWWGWAAAGLAGGATGWWGTAAWRRAERQRRADLSRAVQEAHAQLDAHIHEAQQALAATQSADQKRKLQRLQKLRSDLHAWEREPWQRASTVRQRFGTMLQAVQTDSSWQEYQDFLARQAAEEARRAAQQRRERSSSTRSSSRSSFKGGRGNSWSSGRSSSRRGNNGGSKW